MVRTRSHNRVGSTQIAHISGHDLILIDRVTYRERYARHEGNKGNKGNEESERTVEPKASLHTMELIRLLPKEEINENERNAFERY